MKNLEQSRKAIETFSELAHRHRELHISNGRKTKDKTKMDRVVASFSVLFFSSFPLFASIRFTRRCFFRERSDIVIST